MQKFTVSAVWAAVIKVATMFMPVGLRWAIRLLADVFTQKQATMKATAGAEEVSAAAPDELRKIIQGIFDTLNQFVANRPFILSVVKALQAFILNNLIDAIWDQLTNGGARVASGHALTTFQPKCSDDLTAELDAAVAMG